MGGGWGVVRPHLPTSLRQCGERKKKKGTDKYVVCCFIPLWRGCGVERYIGITLFCSFRVGLGGCCLLNIAAAAVHWVRKTKSLGPLCTFGLQ